MVAGFHLPVIPLIDTAGSCGAVVFWHSELTRLNVGRIVPPMVMFIVAVVAQADADGVNV